MTKDQTNEAERELKAFEREERYIVIKRKPLSGAQEMAIKAHMFRLGIDPVECVVVESDWPEYETVWRMIEDRVTGRTRPTDDLAVSVEALREAGQSIIDRMFSTYKARNGREVGIEGDDGEKCWIVHSDEIESLRAALSKLTGGEA